MWSSSGPSKVHIPSVSICCQFLLIESGEDKPFEAKNREQAKQNIGIAPYPSQVAAGVGDSTDEALLNKLTELEGYINNNNPMRG